ncbi:tetratricopeptide repeat protein [Streptomyces sp. NPDC086077]|uniref:tetratricopeptide repeat protein n=1 Tax=Streptomyces sp. NPDC086077 TaxID=3154862 RepID=UPI0034274147
MDEPTHTMPFAPPPEPPRPPGPPRPQHHDPLAAALGNASLLGVGYWLLGRRALAALALLGTAVLVSVLASTAAWGYEIAALVWWVAVVAHGWFLASRGTPRVASRGQRLIALCVTVPVLLAVGLLRYDAVRIGQDVTEARDKGDCAGVFRAQDEVWAGHRVAGAPVSARGDEVVEDCRNLGTAEVLLDRGLGNDTDALEQGFGILTSVLREPGNERTVRAVLDGFLDGLPTDNPCGTVGVTDWLRDREPTRDQLDRSAGTASRVAPAALVACGDSLMQGGDWQAAKAQYRQLLDEYPDDSLGSRARTGVTKATQAIELDNVRSLLSGTEDEQPEYCSQPAKYSAAKPMGKGTNRALYFGNTEYTNQLPGNWKATDAARAAAVVCVGEPEFGTSVQTCPYQGRNSGAITYVTFHKIAIPVRVYEVRTGKLVSRRTVQISGSSCPAVLSYFSYGDDDTPPRDRYVTDSRSDVRNAFRPLTNR